MNEKPRTRAFLAIPVIGPCGGTYADGYEEIKMTDSMRDATPKTAYAGKEEPEDNQDQRVSCPKCEGTGQMGGKDASLNSGFCVFCNGNGNVPKRVAEKVLGTPHLKEFGGQSHPNMRKLDEEISADRREHIKKLSEPLLQANADDIRHHSGSKYLRYCQTATQPAQWFWIDVYVVLRAFMVTCPARAHAIKKLLCAGLRQKGSQLNDLLEARDCISRAIELQQASELHQAEQAKP